MHTHCTRMPVIGARNGNPDNADGTDGEVPPGMDELVVRHGVARLLVCARRLPFFSPLGRVFSEHGLPVIPKYLLMWMLC